MGLFDEGSYYRCGLVITDSGEHNKARMTFYQSDNIGVFRTLSQIAFPVSGYGSVFDIRGPFASGIDSNPFPLSDVVLDLRTVLLRLRHCCSSFF